MSTHETFNLTRFIRIFLHFSDKRKPDAPLGNIRFKSIPSLLQPTAQRHSAAQTTTIAQHICHANPAAAALIHVHGMPIHTAHVAVPAAQTFQPIDQVLVLPIIRLQRKGLTCLLFGQHIIPQSCIGQSAEEIPTSVMGRYLR